MSEFFSESTAIAISTYNMVAYTQKRAADSQEVSQQSFIAAFTLVFIFSLSFSLSLPPSLSLSLSLLFSDDGLSPAKGVGVDDP